VRRYLGSARTRVFRENTGLSRLLRPLIPPRSWTVAFEALNSGMADALGFRIGIPLMDRNRSTLGEPYHQVLSTLRQGTVAEVAADLEARALALGYVRDQVLGQRDADDPQHTIERHFAIPESMPAIYFAVRAPGQPCAGPGGTCLVPKGWAAVEAVIDAGRTHVSNGRTRLTRPSDATRARMSDLGIDISTPPLWRWWIWWFALTWNRARLSLLAHRLGLYRGKLLAVWKTGGQFLSPTTHGVLTLRPRSDKKPDHATPPRNATSMITATFEAGEQINPDGPPIPAGYVALAVTLTHGRTRSKTPQQQ
jgi:hypothetical protein